MAHCFHVRVGGWGHRSCPRQEYRIPTKTVCRSFLLPSLTFSHEMLNMFGSHTSQNIKPSLDGTIGLVC